MRRIAILALAGAVLWTNPSTHAEDRTPGEILTTLQKSRLVYVDDTAISVRNFADFLHGSGTRPSNRRDRDLDTLTRALDAFIDQFCLILDMDSVAILSDVLSNRRARWRMATAAGPVITRRVVAPQVKVDQADIEQLYNDSLKSAFTAPARREVSHILIAPELEYKDGKRIRRPEHITNAKLRAESLLTELASGGDFKAMAVAFSDDSASQQKQGYLGWLFPGNTTFDFDTAVFAAEVGEVRGPVKTMYGYHLIKVNAERPESTILLDERLTFAIRNQLENAQARRIGTRWADSVMEHTNWIYNDDALADLTGLPDETWVLQVNGRDTLWYREWKGAWEYFKRTQEVEGAGTLEDKHTSLRKTGFVYTYVQSAETLGFGDDSAIVNERLQHIKSETIRLAHARLRDMQVTPEQELKALEAKQKRPPVAKPLHLQMIRNSDTAAIWSAYRSLEAGDDMETVVRWYHDNVREARTGLWDLGWTSKQDLPDGLWGKAWILGAGRHTRPVKLDSTYYILRLQDRKSSDVMPDEKLRQASQLRAEYRRRGLDAWRKEVRANHNIRIDRNLWQRVRQLWRK